jgi:hypothetical protein
MNKISLLDHDWDELTLITFNMGKGKPDIKVIKTIKR